MSNKRNKSGLKPVLYSALSLEDKQEVRALMAEYNNSALEPFFEPEQFYHSVIRGVHCD